jgi:hypothetical protein
MASTEAPVTETLIPTEMAKVPKVSEAPSASLLAASHSAQQASTSPASDPNDHGAQNPAPSDLDRCTPKLRGRPFAPGQSGNPQGRPKGSRNRVTRAVEALIEGQGEALGAKALEKALDGDAGMLRAALNILVPIRRDRTVEFELPKIETAADAITASSAVLIACSRGEISPNEANQILALLASHVRMLETSDIEQRLAALEAKQQK